MSEKHSKGIADAVKLDDAYALAVASLSEADRASVEATVEGFADLLAPMVKTLDELEKSDEVMALVRARLAEKLRGG